MTDTYYEDDYIDYEEEQTVYETEPDLLIADETRAERMAEISRKAPFMSKWLMVLFGVMIASGIADLLSGDNMEEVAPELYTIASIVSLICGIVYLVILFKLSREEALYRKAAQYYLISLILTAITLIIMLVSIGNENEGLLVLSFFAVIAGLVIAFVSEYYEYKAHANVVRDASTEMAAKWEKLWKYYIRMLLGLLGSIVLLALIPMIAAIMLMLLALAIGMLIISIIKIVYVYETAKIFQQYV